MDPPSNDDEVKPETLEEEKEEGPSLHCELFDTEIVHKIAQALLPGLGSACVDNTTGGLFKSPASVAVDIRREMVDYMFQRSENFVAESVILDGSPDVEVPDQPYDIIADFIEDFSSSKRNIFSRVSGWILSDRREDKIDDFVQEMEINGFWLLARREAVAQTLLRNVDIKNTYHCDKKFKTPEDLAEHVLICDFRMMECMNVGCCMRISAAQMSYHDSICPFKILPCEQKCSEILMRREMDRHCITACPMKLVNCPFYPVGCELTVPKCLMDEHLKEHISSHLVHILKLAHKEASLADLQKRAEELEKLSRPGRLVSARGARSLQLAIRDLEAKLGPIEVSNADEKASEASEKQEITGLPTKHEESVEVPDKKEGHSESSPKHSDSTHSSPRKSPTSPAKQEQNRKSHEEKEGHVGSGKEVSESRDSSPRKSSVSFSKEVENRKSLDGKEEQVELSPKIGESRDSSPRKSSVSPSKQVENRKSLDGKEEQVQLFSKNGESTDSSPRKSSASPSKQVENRKSVDIKEERVELSPRNGGSMDSSPRKSSVSPSKQEHHRSSSDGKEEYHA